MPLYFPRIKFLRQPIVSNARIKFGVMDIRMLAVVNFKQKVSKLVMDGFISFSRIAKNFLKFDR